MIALLLALLGAAPAPVPDLRPGALAAAVQAAIQDTRQVYPVEPELVLAVIEVESAFQPAALSRAGAIGLMQVLPENAPRLGLTPQDLWDPARNILAGTRLLAVLLRHYQGDLVRTLIAYNAGPRPPGAKVPDNGETPGYVLRVLARYRELWAQRAQRQVGRTPGGRGGSVPGP